jgi:hypothetical protein
MRKYLAMFLVCVFLVSTLPIVHARTTPSLYVTISKDSVNLDWNMRFCFEGDEGFEGKVDEIREAWDNNYQRKMETALEEYLSVEFTNVTGRQVTVSDLRLSVSGDGEKWTKWISVSVEFTLNGLHYQTSEGTVVDLTWLNMKLSEEKIGFEDKNAPRIKYRFIPKFLLGFNFKDHWGSWDLTAREVQRTGSYLYVQLPCRQEYKPFEGYDVSADPSDPILEIRVTDLNATIRSKTILFPSAPQQPSQLDLAVKWLVDRSLILALIGTAITVMGVSVWFYRKKLNQKKKEKERESKAIQRVSGMVPLRSTENVQFIGGGTIKPDASRVHVSRSVEEKIRGLNRSMIGGFVGRLKRRLRR